MLFTRLVMIGRLEIVAILVLFQGGFWGSRQCARCRVRASLVPAEQPFAGRGRVPDSGDTFRPAIGHRLTTWT